MNKTFIPFSHLVLHSETKKYFGVIAAKTDGGFTRLLKEYMETVVDPPDMQTWLAVQTRCDKICLLVEEMMEMAHEVAKENN